MDSNTVMLGPAQGGARGGAATEPRSGRARAFWHWLSNDPRRLDYLDAAARSRLDPTRVAAFAALHAGCLGVLVFGVSPVAVAVALALYVARMFFITAFYHRYFAHRSFRASRATQLVMAILGCTAGQRGPLWWAGHHRTHHASADTRDDPHSPAHRGMLYSHMGWFLTVESFAVPAHRVRDWLRYPELRILERLDWVPFVLLAIGCYALGALLESTAPALGTNGPQMLVWGFFVSTVALYHATYTINSLAHRFGRRDFDTADDSRNNPWLAALTLGEGWHNNHHFRPSSARLGFRRWQIDAGYAGLKLLESLGLVRELKRAPAQATARGGQRS
ncbi:MAG: acyl-CoA desaturase [Gammaproteobacteria bacterium]|nr:acyl-CoA desaturase [Gammaproteobacteria bacterium]